MITYNIIWMTAATIPGNCSQTLLLNLLMLMDRKHSEFHNNVWHQCWVFSPVTVLDFTHAGVGHERTCVSVPNIANESMAKWADRARRLHPRFPINLHGQQPGRPVSRETQTEPSGVRSATGPRTRGYSTTLRPLFPQLCTHPGPLLFKPTH